MTTPKPNPSSSLEEENRPMTEGEPGVARDLDKGDLDEAFPQPEEWIEEFEQRFGGKGRYLCQYSEGMQAWTSIHEEVLYFIRSLLSHTRTEERTALKEKIEKAKHKPVEEFSQMNRNYRLGWDEAFEEVECILALLTDPKEKQ